MSIENKESLINEFTEFLDNCDLENIPAEDPNDLFSMLSELIALKTEVKLESRQIKRAIDEFKKIFDLLESNNSTLQKQLEEATSTKKTFQKNILRPILHDLLDIQDKLTNNIQAINIQEEKRTFFILKPRKRKTLSNLKKGLHILQRRIEQCLASQQVSEIETSGSTLCPNKMRVHSIGCVKSIDEGIVLDEFRKGYTWGEEVLRLAEVKVNKHEDCHE